jgi:kumamolisin
VAIGLSRLHSSARPRNAARTAASQHQQFVKKRDLLMTVKLRAQNGAPKVAARAALLAATFLLPATAFARGTVAAPKLLGATNPTRQISLAIALPSRDPAGAAAFARHVSTPGDKQYRQYLTPEQFATRFGASVSDYRAAAAWARAHGLTPGEEFTAHTILPVKGAAGDIARAFGVTFHDFQDSAGHIFYKADSAPHVPAELAGRINGVLGLHNEGHPSDDLEQLPKGTKLTGGGTGPGGAYGAADLRTIYGVPAAPALKTGEVAGVFEQGGITPSDITVYEKQNKLPDVPVHARGVNGYGGGVDDPGVELEAILDVDMLIAINPALDRIIVYEVGEDVAFATGLVDVYSAVASDNKIQTFSISYGLDEAQQDPTEIQAENTVLTQLVAQGIAVFASAGDQGAYGREGNGLNAPDPGSQPELTSVGGTTLFTGTKQAYLNEITWNELGSRGFATGGGVSSVWPIPSYQINSSGTSVAVGNGGSSTFRNVPDIAAVADPFTGVAVYSALNGGWIVGLGGTSLSSPLFAGVQTLANANSKALGFGKIGFANPTLYNIAQGATLTFFDFHNVVDGSNGDAEIYGIPGFFAGYGYNNVTGWGSPVANDLTIDEAVQPALSESNPPPAATGLTNTETSTSITIKWSKVAGATGFIAQNFNLYSGAEDSTITKAGTTEVTFSGLTPNTEYGLQVLSVSPGGYTYSLPLYVITPKK